MKFSNKRGKKKFGIKWPQLDKMKMLQFHACMLRMAIINRRNMRHYFWKVDGDPVMKQIKLSRDDYELIYKSIRLYDAGT